jgi:hypothetical protein
LRGKTMRAALEEAADEDSISNVLNGTQLLAFDGD